VTLASIPSPSHGVWHLGPIPIRGYAFSIIIGIVVAVWLGGRRWQAQGFRREDVADVAMWAVPAGIIGGRIYHIITDWQLYFGSEGRGVLAALRIWDGGLGIWGAISLGFAGALYGCRKHGLDFPRFADALAPGIVLAQAIGRIGNWFNQELFGRPTTLPWALEIDVAHRPNGYAAIGLYHPTFLYELIGCVAIAVGIMWAERRYRLRNGQVFALYVASYCLVRFGVESLRIDEAHHILGLRLNQVTAIVVGLSAAWMVRARRVHGD
jgi:prolipoprotein diacylglyceryl transferase